MHLIRNVIILLLLILTGCMSDPQVPCKMPEKTEKLGTRYAQLYGITETPSGYILDIRKSWENNRSKRYFLNRDSNTCKGAIRIPAKRMIVFTGSSVYMIDTLAGTTSIKGFGESSYTGNQKIHDQINSGYTKELGDFSTADLEVLILMDPDVVIVSGTGTDDPKIKRLEQAGIPVIEIVEWMESHPLGMTEWIRVFGILTDNLGRADDIFGEILRRYNELRDSASHLDPGAPMIYDLNVGGIWYIPGELSYIGRILKDANIPYPFESNDRSGSIAKDIEVVMQQQLDDTVWINVNVGSLSSLAASDDRHRLFRAFQLGNVFNYNKRTGVNDITLYWEERALRCDWLLEDFIRISRMGGAANNLHFYRKLEP